MNKRQDDEIPVFMNRENWPEMLKKKKKTGRRRRQCDLHTICKWDDEVEWHVVVVVANQLLAIDTILHSGNGIKDLKYLLVVKGL